MKSRVQNVPTENPATLSLHRASRDVFQSMEQVSEGFDPDQDVLDGWLTVR